jgi:hypothetical protein
VKRGILPQECTSYDSRVSPLLISKRQTLLRERVRNVLGRKLRRRPSVGSLVELNILPEECATKRVAPGLVERRRRVIREGLKDGLRVWVERRVLLMQRRKEEGELEGERERVGVKGLVRRFTGRIVEEEDELGNALMKQKRKAQATRGREVEVARRREDMRKGIVDFGGGDGACVQPTRAKVLGLRRFWEGVIKAAAG